MPPVDSRLDALLGLVAAAPSVELGEQVAAVDAGAVIAERFEIRRRVGMGGMGVVFEAHDLRLARSVAVKLIRRRTDARAFEQFQREAQAMARLSHPNVVEVFDMGMHDDAPFIAMELIEGQSLRSWQALHPPDAVLQAYAQAARGLHAAHEQGVVHRDFKPDNVLVASDGAVKIGDFGLAQLAAAGRAQTTSSGVSSRKTTAAGTPSYASPEQSAGEPSDARSDQFSFCVALWEALGGVSPFLAGAGRLQAIVRCEARGSGLVRERTSRSLFATLRRGMHVDPARRFETMLPILRELEHGPRRRWPWVVTAGLGAALVLSFAPAPQPGGSGLQSEPLPTQPAPNDETAGGPQLQVRALLALAREQVAAWNFTEAASAAERALLLATEHDELELSFAALPILVAAAREVDQANHARWFRQLQAAVNNPALTGTTRAECIEALAEDALASGVYEKSASDFAEARVLFDAAGQSHPALRTRLGRARALLLAGNYPASQREAEAALEAIDADPQAPPGLRARAHSGRAAVLALTGKDADALVHARLAVKLAQRTATTPAELDGLRLVAFVLVRLRRSQEALELLGRLERRLESAMGRSNRRFANLLELRASALAFSGELEASIEASAETIVIKEQLGDPTLADSLNNLAGTYYDLDDIDRAIPLLVRAVDLETTERGADSVQVARIRLNLANYLSAARRNHEARVEVEAVLATFRATPGLDPEEQLAAQLSLATIDYGLSNFADADRELRAVLEDPSFGRLAPGDQGATVLNLVSTVWHLRSPGAARRVGRSLLGRCPSGVRTCVAVQQIVDRQRGIQPHPGHDRDRPPAD